MARPPPDVLTAVVPALDEAPRLPTLLDALLREADRVVVVDGGSVDGSAAVAEAAGARVLSATRGRGPQQDAGAAVATGGLLWFVHADATVAAGAGDAIRRATAPWGCFAVRFEPPTPQLRWAAGWMNARARRTGSATGDMGLWARVDLFRALGGFGPLTAFEDLAFTDRARARAPWAVLVPAIVASPRRWQQRGPVRTMLEMWALRGVYRLGLPPGRLAAAYRR